MTATDKHQEMAKIKSKLDIANNCLVVLTGTKMVDIGLSKGLDELLLEIAESQVAYFKYKLKSIQHE